MYTTNLAKFKGEIERYLSKERGLFESRIEGAFRALRLRTHLSRMRISKQNGYPAGHLLFVLFLLPMLRIPTLHSFCQKKWYQWCSARKDTFYRFKQRPYRWRSFLYAVVGQIMAALGLEDTETSERYLVLDDTPLPKRGRNIENVSFIYDHSRGRSILGFPVLTLGLFTGQNFYPLDFAYRFGKRRHPKSPPERVGDRRYLNGLMSFEAKHYGKVELASQMIQRAADRGIRAGYVLFDSWYAWPWLIKRIREVKGHPHVICRLKDTKTTYQYGNGSYRLSELYRRIRTNLKKDARTGLLLARATVRVPGTEEEAVIVFAKGYCEAEEEVVGGARKQSKPKWVALLSTDTRLHASSIIKKYTKRWTIEVCFKECKQLLGLGKEASVDFNAQIFSTMASFLRYNLLNFLNEKENGGTVGDLFQDLVDESATITYAQRLWNFFRGLFSVALSKIFELFEIEEDFNSYIREFSQTLCASAPFQGCET